MKIRQIAPRLVQGIDSHLWVGKSKSLGLLLGPRIILQYQTAPLFYDAFGSGGLAK